MQGHERLTKELAVKREEKERIQIIFKGHIYRSS